MFSFAARRGGCLNENLQKVAAMDKKGACRLTLISMKPKRLLQGKQKRLWISALLVSDCIDDVVVRFYPSDQCG